VNTIGEPCDRKGHARFDGEVLVRNGEFMVVQSTRRAETTGNRLHTYRARALTSALPYT
jgi:hypothetical protein